MFQEEGYKLRGAAFEVHNLLGYGMAEEAYQQIIEVEQSLRDIPFISKNELSVHYKGHELQTRYKPDLYVCGANVVELKAVAELVRDHEAQLFNYLRIAHQRDGYRINYGHKGEWQWKRFVLSDFHIESATKH